MKTGKDYIGTSAGAVILNPDKKIFMAQRGGGARDDQGLWEFPGGSIKMFESREEAVIRILKLKHNLDIKIVSTLGVYDVIDENGQEDHWISTTYLCEKIAGDEKIMQPEKCDAIGWFSLEEIQTMNISRISNLNLIDLLRKSK